MCVKERGGAIREETARSTIESNLHFVSFLFTLFPSPLGAFRRLISMALVERSPRAAGCCVLDKFFLNDSNMWISERSYLIILSCIPLWTLLLLLPFSLLPSLPPLPPFPSPPPHTHTHTHYTHLYHNSCTNQLAKTGDELVSGGVC